jgi:cytochrome c553
MKVIAFVMTVSILIFASKAKAQDAAKGAQLFTASCVSCHGQNAAGSEQQKAPRLAGQYDWYIVTALNDFKKNARDHTYKQSLSEKDMEDLAAHISRLK